MVDPSNLDDLEISLRDTLRRIEREVAKILDGECVVADPDAVIEGLDAQADDLCRSLQELDGVMAQAERCGPCDLEKLADAALARQIDAVSFPVVTQRAWAGDLPPLAMPAGTLRSLLEQVLRGAIRYAAHGGEVHMRTMRDGDAALLAVAAVNGDGAPPPSDEVSTRLASVAEFVAHLGGGFSTSYPERGSLRLELRLPVGVEIH